MDFILRRFDVDIVSISLFLLSILFIYFILSWVVRAYVCVCEYFVSYELVFGYSSMLAYICQAMKRKKERFCSALELRDNLRI